MLLISFYGVAIAKNTPVMWTQTCAFQHTVCIDNESEIQDEENAVCKRLLEKGLIATSINYEVLSDHPAVKEFIEIQDDNRL